MGCYDHTDQAIGYVLVHTHSSQLDLGVGVGRGKTYCSAVHRTVEEGIHPPVIV